MEFFTAKDYRPKRGAQVFRHSRLASLIWFVGFFGGLTALLYVAVSGGIETETVNLPAPLAYWMAAVLAVIAALAGRRLTLSLKPDNWMARVHAGGLDLHLRSYLNSHLPKDCITVARLEWREIRTAEVISKWISTMADHRTRVQYIVFDVDSPDIDTLDRHLRAVQHQRTGTGVWQDYPVQVVMPMSVRVQWNDISPPIPSAIEALRRHGVSIRHGSIDLIQESVQPQDEPADVDSKILELVLAGNKIAAIKLARQRYGLSLAEAKCFVEDLMGR